MKNLYLLPTDKPSKLFDCFGKLNIGDYTTSREDLQVTNQHIYITSDEEIKKGEYGFSRLGEIIKFHSGYDYRYYAKIILTTDQDLIADGVQAIDDEFLQWFVKNLSCEYVEVIELKYKSVKTNYTHSLRWGIIIPQEETKNPNNQEVMFHEERKEHFYEDFIDGKFVTVWLGKDYIPKEEPKQELLPDFKITKNIFDFVTDLSDTNKEEPKQETLEEALDRKYPLTTLQHLQLNTAIRTGFEEGAKWQEKRRYSEEQVIKLLIYCKDRFGGSGLEDYHHDDEVKEWFEQFKKD